MKDVTKTITLLPDKWQNLNIEHFVGLATKQKKKKKKKKKFLEAVKHALFLWQIYFFKKLGLESPSSESLLLRKCRHY